MASRQITTPPILHLETCQSCPLAVCTGYPHPAQPQSPILDQPSDAAVHTLADILPCHILPTRPPLYRHGPLNIPPNRPHDSGSHERSRRLWDPDAFNIVPEGKGADEAQ